MAAGCSVTEGACLDLLRSRERSEGGFAEVDSGELRPDSNAWATLALAAGGAPAAEVHRARRSLAAAQQSGGGVPLSPKRPQASWPTAPAVLAWGRESAFAAQRERAVAYLLSHGGERFPLDVESTIGGHDTSLRGWPWIDGTHSWVEPTALALLALRRCGYGEHARCREAITLLLDRQLPGGGWNYGNTIVFGQSLRPMIDSTGVALASLAGSVPRAGVAESLRLLEQSVARLSAPLSLAWALLALTAWGERPATADEAIRRSLARQATRGAYPTSPLALLLLASYTPNATLLGEPT